MGTDAIPTNLECHGCLEEQKKRKKAPRYLYEMPEEVVNDHLFKRRTALYLCAHCDGDAIEHTITQHRKRQQGA